MKDPGHHPKKLNQRVLRSFRARPLEAEANDLLAPRQDRPMTEQQRKKQRKIREAQSKKARAVLMQTPDEQNRKRKKRGPVFDPISHWKPRKPSTRKKTPPL